MYTILVLQITLIIAIVGWCFYVQQKLVAVYEARIKGFEEDNKRLKERIQEPTEILASITILEKSLKIERENTEQLRLELQESKDVDSSRVADEIRKNDAKSRKIKKLEEEFEKLRTDLEVRKATDTKIGLTFEQSPELVSALGSVSNFPIFEPYNLVKGLELGVVTNANITEIDWAKILTSVEKPKKNPKIFIAPLDDFGLPK
ncbi:MAG: hypothetical protein ACUZ8N_08935 [Candidatus Scalindua sp.]